MGGMDMSKKLDLTRPVHDLVNEYPELVDIMKGLGFSEIAKPAMLNSVGRIMTIPKGAKMKRIPMMDVVTTLIRSGFELAGEMPDFTEEEDPAGKAGGDQPRADGTLGKQTSPAGFMQTADFTEEERKAADLLKSYLMRLGDGESLEQVRSEFVEHFSSVDPALIMQAEQELIREGAPISEVQKLCDVHSALFHGATQQEKIDNAEKAVEKSLRTRQLRAIPGHPLNTLFRENEGLSAVIEELEQEIEKGEVSEGHFAALRQVSTHYAKKGDLLYPHLKVRYGVSGPSEVMWSVDDEIRDSISALAKEGKRDEGWMDRLGKVIQRAREMIYKEENILFPICAVQFSEEEWLGVYQDSLDFPMCFGVDPHWAAADEKQKKKLGAEQFGTEKTGDGEIRMPGGHLTLPQLTAMLNTVPFELTFVDDLNINRYFNEGQKVFKRPKMAIDREVFSCHPPKIEPMVRSILDDFRNGKRDQVPVWMEKEGKPFLVLYMAVRDRDGSYLGTVEVVQDMSAAKEHFSV
jgi:DUF438 domain-containing protein